MLWHKNARAMVFVNIANDHNECKRNKKTSGLIFVAFYFHCALCS